MIDHTLGADIDVVRVGTAQHQMGVKAEVGGNTILTIEYTCKSLLKKL